MMVRRASPISPTFIVLNVIAAVFLAAGILGLLMPDLVPPLAAPKVAWSLIGVGVIMDGAAIVHLIVGLKDRVGARGKA